MSKYVSEVEEELYASDWFRSRPQSVQEAIRAYPPMKHYLLNGTHVVNIQSYEEDDDGACTTCRVCIAQENNPHMVLAMERSVFGVRLDKLEPFKIYNGVLVPHPEAP